MRIMEAMRFCGRFRVRQTSLTSPAYYLGRNKPESQLQAIEEAAPLPDRDLSLIDELPYAPGLLAHPPDDLRERLAAAFGLQAIYRRDTRQATIVLTITDTINAILADPAPTTTPPPVRCVTRP
jgi:hypothetical protein